MARAKRSLAEADSNVEPAPPAKKTSTGKAKRKENDAPTASEISSKASMVKHASTDASKSRVTPKDKDGKVPQGADGKIWICMCRPIQDIIEENEIDEDAEEAIEKLQSCRGGEECICKKPADDFPQHKWIVTKKGFELALEWQTEQAKRDQDNFDMHIFNDFSGYGTVEVMENTLLAFDKEFKKKTQDPLAIWSHIEGLALFLNGDLQLWGMIDDSEGNAKLVSVIGTAVLSTIDLIIGQDLFANDSLTIPNLGLVLSYFLKFANSQHDTCQHNENGWAAVIIKRADEHRVFIEGMAGIRDTIQSVRDNLDCTEVETSKLGNDMTMVGKQRMRMWKSWDWNKEFGRYRKTQGAKVGLTAPSSGRIGGNYYDLTAKKNKGPHMKRYMIGGESDDEDST